MRSDIQPVVPKLPDFDECKLLLYNFYHIFGCVTIKYMLFIIILLNLILTGSQIKGKEDRGDIDIDRLSLCEFSNDVFTHTSRTNGKQI